MGASQTPKIIDYFIKLQLRDVRLRTLLYNYVVYNKDKQKLIQRLSRVMGVIQLKQLERALQEYGITKLFLITSVPNLYKRDVRRSDYFYVYYKRALNIKKNVSMFPGHFFVSSKEAERIMDHFKPEIYTWWNYGPGELSWIPDNKLIVLAGVIY